ncbi:neurogenic locus protein delta isoform X3 [Leptopilina boulardi]|uniref:neurogenic locus protein delta isoform X3 n=1 Tax=Leptopilina boulardi TaxID=63433 RepID=UPI0021F6199D|nr:neurogenic locus protein delta isoform X3 [Leptopilina boulardi]
MWTTMLVWTAAVVLLPSPRAVHGAGVFELRLRSFVNEFGKDSLGKCCSGSTTRTGECSGACKIRFRACLKQYQNTIDTSTSCTYGDVITPVLGENNVNFTSTKMVSNIINPLRFPFEFSWPGSFSLIVEAYHDTDNITNNTSEKVLLARLATQMWLGIGPKWIEVEEQNAHSLMAYGFRVICAPNYYGQKCENFCRPRDDRFGHNSCSPTGERICLSGWTGDYCNKPSCLPGCDEQHGHCNRPNECICHTGWKGPFCDQCEMYPGCKHGICHKPWECLCDEGWGGLFCNQDLNYCTNHKPCRNNGTCFNTGQGSYTCSCAPGFTGTDCEKSLLDCHAKPCLNGGLCSMEQRGNSGSGGNETTAIGKINSQRAYRCTCPAGWRGRHCEISTRSCRDMPCSHGATCEDDSLRGYTCLCPPGFTGHECELQIDECAPNPCSNGGTCSDMVNGFNCSCPLGFSGERCEINIDDCQGDPCLNGGTCKDMINQFRCLCVPGFVGRLCQDKVDYCQTKPCANGGKCISGTNDYQCQCKAGFTGKDCSIFVDECKSGPCQNGGSCRNVVNGFLCECPEGYRGDTCAEEGSAVAVASSAINVPPSGASYWSGNLSKHVASAEARNEGLTTEHVVVIATLSTAVPAFVLVAAIAVMCMKSRQKREQAKADEEARLQNERNAVHSSMSKRGGIGGGGGNTVGIIGNGNVGGLLSNGNGIGSVCTLGAGDAHMIKNTWTANKSVNNASVREDLDSSFQTEDSSCSGYKPEPVLQDGRSRSTKQLNTEAAAHRASHLFQKEKECSVMESKRTSVFAGNPTVGGTVGSDSCCGEAALLKRPSTLGDGSPPSGGGGGSGPNSESGCGVYVIDDHYRHDAALAATLATEV